MRQIFHEFYHFCLRKKPLIILILLVASSVLYAYFAYVTSETRFENIPGLDPDKAEFFSSKKILYFTKYYDSPDFYFGIGREPFRQDCMCLNPWHGNGHEPTFFRIAKSW